MADEPFDSAWAILKQNPDRHPGPEHLSGQRVPDQYPMNLHRPTASSPPSEGIRVGMNVGVSTRDLLQFARENDMSLQQAHYVMQKIKQEEHMLNQMMYNPSQSGDVLPQNVGEPTFQSVPFNEGTNFTMGESMDLAFRLLKRDMHDITNDMPSEERNARYQSNIRNLIAQQAEEQKRAEIEAANAEARKRLQAQQAPPQRPYGPISPEDLRRLQLQALRRMRAQQAPKISNYMADSAQSMAQNNPTANLAHSSGNLPGVPLPDTEPLDLSMESLRENQE